MSAQSIPLNIKDELSNRSLVGRLLVIVERVPAGASALNIRFPSPTRQTPFHSIGKAACRHAVLGGTDI